MSKIQDKDTRYGLIGEY